MDADAESTGEDEMSQSANVHDMRLLSNSSTHHRSHCEPSSAKSYNRLNKKQEGRNPLEDCEGSRSYSYSQADIKEQKSTSGTLANEDSIDSTQETSPDETSFISSICSEKETQSSSELSVDPVVWKKFKFLSSILKETQHNLRAMDDLILEHRRIQDLTNLEIAQNSASPSCSHLSVSDHQKLGEGEPKTDEAKLEEILGLLHNLTSTLTSYEQHPLLASITKASEVATSSIPSASHLQHLVPVSPSRGVPNFSGTIQQQSSPEKYATQLTPLSTRSQNVYQVDVPQFVTLPEHHSSSRLNHFELMNSERDSMPLDASSVTLDFYGSPRTGQGHLYTSGEEQGTRNVFCHSVPQCSPAVVGKDLSQQGQDTLSHPLTKETRSLRKDIDDIVVRKQALDSRLQSLIAHRASQRELEQEQMSSRNERHIQASRSHSHDDASEKRQRYRGKKHKSRSSSQEENSKAGTSIRDTYLTMISEDKDEFPSLVMGDSIENEEKICELRNDEADLPGLGDSGLSSEINSINATIQELIKENQRLHTFLQGITCESIAKVDQQKLELEAQIQSLNEENNSLKLAISGGSKDKEEDEADSLVQEGSISAKQEGKAVTFSLSDDSKKITAAVGHKDGNLDTINATGFKNSQEEIDFLLKNGERVIAQNALDTGKVHLNIGVQNEELLERIKALEKDVDHLTRENKELLQKDEEVDDTEGKNYVRTSTHSEDILQNSDHVKSNKELEALKGKVQRLMDENTQLNFKFNNEVTERDLECSRLEARIRILSERNQSLNSRLSKNESTYQGTSKVKEKFSLTSGIFMDNDSAEKDVDNDSAIGEVVVAPNLSDNIIIKPVNVMGSPVKALIVSKDSWSQDAGNVNEDKVLNKVDSEIVGRGNGVEGIPNEHAATGNMDENLNKHNISLSSGTENDEKNKTSDENIEDNYPVKVLSVVKDKEYNKLSGDHHTESKAGFDSLCSKDLYTDMHKASDASSSGFINPVANTSKSLYTEDSKLTKQLEALMQQNERLNKGLDDIRNSTKLSETNLEATVLQMLSEHREVIEDMKEKLDAGRSVDLKESNEQIDALSKEKQELMLDLLRKQNRIESLTSENNSLEKKLQFARKGSKERRLGFHLTDGEQKENNPTLLRQQTKDNGNSSLEDMCQPDKSTHGSRSAHMLGASVLSDDLKMKDSPKSESSESLTSNGFRSGSVIQPMGVAKSSRNSSPEPSSLGSRGSTGSEGGIPNSSFRKEKENWAKQLKQAEAEKKVLQNRISTLVSENDCLASRLEEIMSVSRNLRDQMHGAKEQLAKVSAEKDDLQKKFKLLEDSKEDSSLSLSDSGASTRLTQRMRDRIRTLQGEVEGAWQEVHMRTMERDKVKAERECLEYTSGIAVDAVKKEVDALKLQIVTLEREMEKKLVDLAGAKNELDKKAEELKTALDEVAHHEKKLRDASSRIEELECTNMTCKDQLERVKLERKKFEIQLEESSQAKSSTPHQKSDKKLQSSDRNYLELIAQLKGQLHEEQLRARLLEAADQESSARIMVLQHSVRDTIEAHEALQAKYKQLRVAYRAKKMEKTSQKESSQQYSVQIKELYKTSDALEENYKIMLSSLGENIEVAVGILTSHVFMSPCVIHPSTNIRKNPEAWFSSQLGKLRWLQTQLRKLCLHTWKTADLPRTSNLGTSTMEDLNITEETFKMKSSKCNVKDNHNDSLKQTSSASNSPIRYTKKTSLSELSILDGSRSYPSTPVKKLSMSGLGLSSGYSGVSSSTPQAKSSGIIHVSQENLNDTDISQIKGARFQENLLRPIARDGYNSSMSVNEAEKFLTLQQQQLSEAKFQQYKTLVFSLQRDLVHPRVSTPSVPSSMLTTPEDIQLPESDSSDDRKSGTYKSTSSVGKSASSSKTLVSSSLSRTPSEARRLSLNLGDLSENQKSLPNSSDDTESQSTPRPVFSQRSFNQEESKGSCNSTNVRDIHDSYVLSSSDRSSDCIDIDKDRDSWEAGSSDEIGKFVDRDNNEKHDHD